jgi:hypothetical protein
VPEIGLRVSHPRVAAEDDETGDSDEDQRKDLDDANGVLEPVRESSVEKDDCRVSAGSVTTKSYDL